MRRLTFAATTYDIQHWNQEREEQFPDGQDDAFDALEAVMLDAGRKYARAHPDIFRAEVT